MQRLAVIPSMRPHPSGQARVRVSRPITFMGMSLKPGQALYMGVWGSDEARKRYAAFRLAWQQAVPAKPTMPTSTGMSIGELALRFTAHAEDQWGVQSPNTWKVRSVYLIRSAPLVICLGSSCTVDPQKDSYVERVRNFITYQS